MPFFSFSKPAGVVLALLLWASTALAQLPPQTPTAAERAGAATFEATVRGRRLITQGDPRAVEVLREASQDALRALSAALRTKTNPLEAAPGALNTDTLSSALAMRAADVHLAWGAAAEEFARRDEAITAYTRALRIARGPAGLDSTREEIALDARRELTDLLGSGLPLVAPDDVLRSIALLAHGGLWSPRIESFPLGENPKSSASLVTDGTLFVTRERPGAPLYRIPALYSSIDSTKLAPSMRLNQSVLGYARVADGPNLGQWRQVVRVFYASSRLLRDRRDDGPRALRLAQDFVRLHTLFERELGARNLYTRGERDAGVTTLWLLEVPATWPRDDDDPLIQAQLGPRLPPINTGPVTYVEPQVTPLVRPWLPFEVAGTNSATNVIAGQSDATPGEVLFWRSGYPRPETEWLREMAHEYGHVSLPPIGGFAPPLEPFANGLIGETLAMQWAAATPAIFGSGTTANTTANAFLQHVEANAKPAREAFIAVGPSSRLIRDNGERGLLLLQGLSVYLERVYGGQKLGEAFDPLSRRAAQTLTSAERRSLLTTDSLLSALDTYWKLKPAESLPIYLPAALGLQLDARTLVERRPITMTPGMRLEGWLYVPKGATSLRVDGKNAQNLRASGLIHNSASNAVRFHFGGKTGWQRVTFSAENELEIAGAKLE